MSVIERLLVEYNTQYDMVVGILENCGMKVEELNKLLELQRTLMLREGE